MRNKSFADAAADFKARGIRRRHLYERACAENPALAEVRGQIKQAGLEKLEHALRGQMSEGTDRLLAGLEKKEQEILRGMPAGRAGCDVCGDTGLANGGYCPCFLDYIYRNCYGAADIDRLPACFDQFDLSVFDNEKELLCGKTQWQLAEYARKTAREYIEDFPDSKRQNIVLAGKAGLGKTYLLHCMAKLARARGIDVMLIRANELFGLFHAHRMGGEVDLSYLQNAGLLLVDDLGTEPVTNNVSIEYFYDLVEKRLTGGLHTVYATNIDNLLKRYDERIASRLESRAQSIRLLLDGGDLRKGSG